jgi:hypothetical protein
VQNYGFCFDNQKVCKCFVIHFKKKYLKSNTITYFRCTLLQTNKINTMTTKNTFSLIMASTFLTISSYGQTTTPADSLKSSKEVKKVDAPKTEKMKTLFSGTKKPTKSIKYLGLSFGSEYQYGSLAGQFTSMAGVTGTLHIDKKWGIGLAGYRTVRNFTPTALNANSLLNLNLMYGGLKLEYTPNPNSAVHVSFPLLIGGGMARVDSANNYTNGFWGYDGRGRNNRRDFNGRDNTGFWVIQPGINIEANVIRFLKIYAGASYRLTPSVNTETTSVLPTPTANQLSGLNFSAGIKLGFFDYQLHRERKAKKEGLKGEGRRKFGIF